MRGMNEVTALQEEPDENNIFEMKAMNCTFYISISNSELSDWKSMITAVLTYFDRQFSRFRNNNELWRFNELEENSTIEVSPIFYDLLKKAEEYHSKTGGRFSPYLLEQLEIHGYDSSFPFKHAKGGNPKPFEKEIEEPPIIFHEEAMVTKRTGRKIDLGGIAKAYAVEAIARMLQQHAKSRFGMVDGGGDMQLWSNGEKIWRIGIMDPFEEDKKIGSFKIKNGGVATSNIIYRSWWQGDTKKHHLLDGRTGMPVKSEIAQATFVTKHVLDAEIGAKICFMDGGEELDSLLKKMLPPYNYVLVSSDGRIVEGGVKYEY